MGEVSSEIIINSEDRISGEPADFLVKIPSQIRDFHSYTLVNVMIPNVYYNVTTNRKNNGMNVNGTYSTIISGTYSLQNYMASLMSIFPTLTITFNVTTCRINITSASAFVLDFSNTNVSGTASALGFDKILYGSTNNISASYPPNLSPLGILINVDVVPNVVSISSPQVTSSSFLINNNTDSLYYTQFFENTQFEQTIHTKNPISDSLYIRLLDLQGYKLENCGEWVMIIRLNRETTSL